MICAKCGNTLVETAKFCPKCGERVDPMLVQINSSNDLKELIQKAYYYLEENNDIFVNCCIERLSLLDITNVELHILRLLIECKVKSISELSDYSKGKIEESINFKRILKYGDDSIKEQFTNIANSISKNYDELQEKLRKEEEERIENENRLRLAEEEAKQRKIEEEIERKRLEEEKRQIELKKKKEKIEGELSKAKGLFVNCFAKIKNNPMIKIIIIIFVAIIVTVFGISKFSEYKQVKEEEFIASYFYAYSDVNKFVEEDLLTLHMNDLYAINDEILARHGVKTDNTILKEIYKDKEWYNSMEENFNFDLSQLNEIETYNYNLVNKIIKERTNYSPYSDVEKFTVEYVESLETHKAQAILEEILARHGVLTDNALLSPIYRAAKWYNEMPENENFKFSELNDVEMHNYKLLYDYIDYKNIITKYQNNLDNLNAELNVLETLVADYPQLKSNLNNSTNLSGTIKKDNTVYIDGKKIGQNEKFITYFKYLGENSNKEKRFLVIGMKGWAFFAYDYKISNGKLVKIGEVYPGTIFYDTDLDRYKKWEIGLAVDNGEYSFYCDKDYYYDYKSHVDLFIYFFERFEERGKEAKEGYSNINIDQSILKVWANGNNLNYYANLTNTEFSNYYNSYMSTVETKFLTRSRYNVNDFTLHCDYQQYKKLVSQIKQDINNIENELGKIQKFVID